MNGRMTSTEYSPNLEPKETSWWKKIIDPAEMFPHLQYEVAVVLYSCIVAGILILLLLSMWLCTNLAGRKHPEESADQFDEDLGISQAPGKPPWSITGRNGNKKGFGTTRNKEGDSGTLKHLESMPWWDFVSRRPGINWYDYYRMSEGKTRARTCERKRYPWPTNARARSYERPKSYRTDSDIRLPSDGDPCWERVHPRTVELTRYRYSPRTRDTGFFPRFRMIPRASWSNERLLGCLSPSGVDDDYANRSIASLTSADMQIMQMVAKRQQQYIRPNRGDVFFGQYLGPLCSGSDLYHNHNHFHGRSSSHGISPYDVHNRNVARRQVSRASQNCQTDPPSLLSNFEGVFQGDAYHRAHTPPPPSPPAYPPPPTPDPPRIAGAI